MCLTLDAVGCFPVIISSSKAGTCPEDAETGHGAEWPGSPAGLAGKLLEQQQAKWGGNKAGTFLEVTEPLLLPGETSRSSWDETGHGHQGAGTQRRAKKEEVTMRWRNKVVQTPPLSHVRHCRLCQD